MAAHIDLGVEAWLDPDDRVDVYASRSLSSDSQFQAGSLAKYTCTLIALRLADEGRLSLDSSLSDLLPDYAGPGAREITLRGLLTNRSGLPDDLLPAIRSDPSIATADLSAIEAANRFAAGEIDAERDWSYDLGNWIIVQAAIEAASGKSIEQVAIDELLKPAGMSASRFDAGTPVLANSPEPAEPVRPFPPFLKCAGGLVSTPVELLRMVDWAYSGGLSQESIESLHQTTTEEENYTIGGRVRVVSGNLLSWQSGSNGPYKSQVVYDPATGSGWAAMTASNSSTELAEARGRWLAARGL